jgi:type III secretion protein J
MRVSKVIMTCALLLLITGCGSSPVADDLNQREANQIVAVLRDSGIDATTEKGRGSKARYTVSVASSKFGEAVSLLSKLGLPGEKRASFAELMAPSGILPSSQGVEDLRLDRAIASEVEDLLEGHNGISSAHVVVRSHSINSGADSSVSLVIVKKEGSTVVESDIRQVVGRAVPGVRAENILLAISQAPSSNVTTTGTSGLVPFLIYWKVPESEYTRLAFLFVALLALVAAMAGIGGYIWGQFSATRSAEAPSSESGMAKGRRGTDEVLEDEV